MRALLYLLPLTFGCFLKNGFCSKKEFESNKDALSLVGQYHDKQKKEINTRKELLDELSKKGLGMSIQTLQNRLKEIKEAGGGSRNRKQISLDDFKNNTRAMSLVEQFNNKQIKKPKELLKKLKAEGLDIPRHTLIDHLAALKNKSMEAEAKNSLAKAHQNLLKHQYEVTMQSVPGFDATAYLTNQSQSTARPSASNLGTNRSQSTASAGASGTNPAWPGASGTNRSQSTAWPGASNLGPNQSQLTEMWDFSNPAPFPQAPKIAHQSSNFTSGNPGSSTSASNKGKSINFTKESNKGKSTNFTKASNSDKWSLSSITGFMPSWFGASQQEPQFSPSMHDTSAASSYYPSNQPDDQTLESMITPRNQKGSASHYGGVMSYQQVPPVQDKFVPSHAGTDSTNFFGGWQNNDGDLASVVRPKNTSSSKGFYGTPFLPNQLQSTGWPGASNFFSPTPNTSNFTSGNPGSSAKPFQQVPMPGTSFPSFPNYPSNQSAQLNSSTNFGLSQTETNWSGGNSQNNAGTLDSVVNKRKPSSSKGTNATKPGKKPRK